jgi:hypothetical protein
MLQLQLVFNTNYGPWASAAFMTSKREVCGASDTGQFSIGLSTGRLDKLLRFVL